MKKLKTANTALWSRDKKNVYIFIYSKGRRSLLVSNLGSPSPSGNRGLKIAWFFFAESFISDSSLIATNQLFYPR